MPDPLGIPVKTPTMAIDQLRDEFRGSGSISSPQLSAASSGDSIPLGTPVKTRQVVKYGPPVHASPDDDSPAVVSSDDTHSSFVQTDVMMTQTNDGSCSIEAASSPLGTSDPADGPAQMASHSNPLVATIEASAACRQTRDRPRGRRAGRRHPPPERLTHLRGARLLRLINAGR